jgi:hypothetical protein
VSLSTAVGSAIDNLGFLPFFGSGLDGAGENPRVASVSNRRLAFDGNRWNYFGIESPHPVASNQ